MPTNTNVLLIRHAEKPDDDHDKGLAVAGQERAQAYVVYFRNYPSQAHPLKLDHVFAAQDSGKSHRPRLTITPLAEALDLVIDLDYEDKDVKGAAAAILALDDANVLVCWHHGEILELAHKLGAPHHTLPPKWPGDVFGWLLQLSFDAKGKLSVSVVDQQLMYDDYGKPPPALG
jgi:phosphohistidine phosphatase SixA